VSTAPSTRVGVAGAPALTAPGPGTDEPSAPTPFADTAPRRSPTWRRVLTVVAWFLGVALGGLAIAVVSARPAPDEYLHPDGTGPAGTRALVEVLRDRGIDVDVVGGVDDVRDASGPGTTVVVGNSDLLNRTSAIELLDAAADADRLVLLDAAPGVLADLDLGLDVQAPSSDPRPGCDAGWAAPEDVVSRASWTLVPTTDGPSEAATECFPLRGQKRPEDGVVARGFAVVDLPGTATDAPTTVVGVPDAATNRFVTEADNAGVMVRLLGGSPRLLWLHPSALDLGADTGAESEPVWPDWLRGVLVLLGLAFLALAVARGRRLGRLVPEPLPVVVRAVETTESRAELYRAARDRPRAAVVLRRASAGRLAARLGLRQSTPPSVLVPAVADATGVPAAEVERLLVGPVPTDDAGLVTLARQLAHLEEKARRP